MQRSGIDTIKYQLYSHKSLDLWASLAFKGLPAFPSKYESSLYASWIRIQLAYSDDSYFDGKAGRPLKANEAQRLISLSVVRLGKCPGKCHSWFWSSLCTYPIAFILFCFGSYLVVFRLSRFSHLSVWRGGFRDSRNFSHLKRVSYLVASHMLHTKNQDSLPVGFRQEDFALCFPYISLCKTCVPLEGAIFGPRYTIWTVLGDATNQISRL